MAEKKTYKYIRTCVFCGKEFEANFSQKLTCSTECSAERRKLIRGWKQKEMTTRRETKKQREKAQKIANHKALIEGGINYGKIYRTEVKVEIPEEVRYTLHKAKERK